MTQESPGFESRPNPEIHPALEREMQEMYMMELAEELGNTFGQLADIFRPTDPILDEGFRKARAEVQRGIADGSIITSLINASNNSELTEDEHTS
jgi:hypothetical protein